MIILNTINHENTQLEYHFAHEDFNGAVFKIKAKFDLEEENGEHYLSCNYDELDHIFNEIDVSKDEVKRVCDEFAMGTLQSLYKQFSDSVTNGAEILNDRK